MSADQYATTAFIGDGITICGIAPQKRLTTLSPDACWNCGVMQVFRLFSGSGWYEDHAICMACGENVSSGYRPFRPAWRKKNIAKAETWAESAVSWDEFHGITMRVIKHEMGWDEAA